MNSIIWGRKLRTRKSENGHTAIRYGRGQQDTAGWQRYYVICECGVRCSGMGRNDYGKSAHRSHRRHQQRKGKVR